MFSFFLSELQKDSLRTFVNVIKDVVTAYLKYHLKKFQNLEKKIFQNVWLKNHMFSPHKKQKFVKSLFSFKKIMIKVFGVLIFFFFSKLQKDLLRTFVNVIRNVVTAYLKYHLKKFQNQNQRIRDVPKTESKNT